MSDSTGKTLGIMGHKFRAVKTRTNRHLRVSKTQGDIKHRWEHERKASCGQTGRQKQNLTSPSQTPHYLASQDLALSFTPRQRTVPISPQAPSGCGTMPRPTPLPGLALPPNHAKPKFPHSPSWSHRVISTRDLLLFSLLLFFCFLSFKEKKINKY